VPGRAGQLLVHRRAAVAVRQLDRRPFGLSHVLVSPAEQGHHHGVQLDALVGQPVLAALSLAFVLIGRLPQQAVADQPGQPVAEHLAGHASAPLHVVEPADAVERLAQYQKCPFLAHDCQRGGDRAASGVVLERPWSSHNVKARST